jgi:hypothetical protein
MLGGTLIRCATNLAGIKLSLLAQLNRPTRRSPALTGASGRIVGRRLSQFRLAALLACGVFGLPVLHVAVAINTSGQSVYRIAKETGIPQPVLHRFNNGDLWPTPISVGPQDHAAEQYVERTALTAFGGKER